MQVKVLVLLVVVAALLGDQVVTAAYPEHEWPTEKQLGGLNLKCIPGRTRLKIAANTVLPPAVPMEESGLSDDEPDHDYRRRHTLANTKEQACQVCVCSVEGKDEHCQSRPAHNVNECIRMTYLAQKYKSGLLPFELGRNIHQAIRRVDSSLDRWRQCIPLDEEYTDCNDDNSCSGCLFCECDFDGNWACRTIHDCSESSRLGDQTLDHALRELHNLIMKQEKSENKARKPRRGPSFTHDNKDGVLGYLITIS